MVSGERLYFTHPEDFLTLEEWHILLKAAQSTREVALLWLIAGCGLRVSNVAAWKVSHLDGAGGCLQVVKGKGVSGAHLFSPSLS